MMRNIVSQSKNTKIATKGNFENMPGQNIWYISISNKFLQNEFYYYYYYYYYYY